MMTQAQIKPLSAEEELQKTFRIFDIDGNGFICADEIKKTMENLGESLTDDEVKDMIKAADKNGTFFIGSIIYKNHSQCIILKNCFKFYF